nr:hypothetical protein [uncultured Flavobacterium sp.]
MGTNLTEEDLKSLMNDLKKNSSENADKIHIIVSEAYYNALSPKLGANLGYDPDTVKIVVGFPTFG